MATLSLSPGSFKQSTFDKVGDSFQYDTIHLKTGAYTASLPYQLNSGTTITADPGATITLIPNASESLFPSMRPIFGQVEKTIQDIDISGLTIDGNSGRQTVPSGKGYHNAFWFQRSENINIHDLTIQNSQGDGLRITDGKNITFARNKVLRCGHDAVYCDKADTVDVFNNYVELRVNSGCRLRHTQNGHVYNNYIINKNGGAASSPGMQIEVSTAGMTSKNILIENNEIRGTWGPGIWVIGRENSNISAASGLTIRNNLFVDCGNMDGSYHHIPGVGGIVADGWNDLDVSYNTFDKCLGYGVSLGPYVSATPAGKGYSAKIYRNIITNTQKSNEVGTASGAAVANLVPDRYVDVEVYENCTYGNVRNYYGVTPAKEILSDPLYAGDGDYHLKSTAGRYSGSQWVQDEVMSPCVFSDFELGRYSGTSDASRYTAQPEPDEPDPVQTVYVVIPCDNEEIAKTTADGHEGAFIIYRK